jgi:hypothetical protein
LALILNRFKRFEEEMGKEDAEPQEVQMSWAEQSHSAVALVYSPFRS